MPPLFDGRSAGRSRQTVAESFEKLRSEHATAVGQLQAELARVQAQADAASERLRALEADLRAVGEQLRALLTRASEYLMRGSKAIEAVGERSAQAEAELEAEIGRLTNTFDQLSEVQHRLGTDIGDLTQRYREKAAMLRQTVPGQKE